METLSVQLTPDQYKLYMFITWASYKDFSERIADVDDKELYEDLIISVRKFKILWMPLPPYLSNLNGEEMVAFQKAKQAMKIKVMPELDDLDDKDFYWLVMILFRGEVQYA